MSTPVEHDSSRGAAAVEFAIVAPLLLLLLLGIVDFGRLYFVQVSMNAASREAARASSLYRTATDVAAIANASSPSTAAISSLGSTSSFTVTTVAACPASPTATSLTSVRVSAPFSWIMPIGFLTFYRPDITRSLATVTSTSAMLCVR